MPAGGPPEAAGFERIGTVQARKLHSRPTWTRRPAMNSPATPETGGSSTIGATNGPSARPSSGQPRAVDGERWRRIGTYLAWQVREDQVLRTMEGRAVARAGDWVVEGHGGERWPVTDEQFRRTYRRYSGKS